MKISLALTSIIAVLANAGCGSSRSSHEATLSLVHNQFELSGQSTHFNASISSSIELQHATSKTEDGWLVLSWTSSTPGTATLTVSPSDGSLSQSMSLTIETGASAIVINPSQKVKKAGHVSGSSYFVCGPRGARCEIPIPLVEGDQSFPCGPYGATCHVKVPQIVKDLLSSPEFAN